MLGCSSEPPLEDKHAKTTPYVKNYQLQNLKHHLQVLSADDMQGREFASIGSIKAQNYIINTLSASQVLPFQSKYRHSFKYETFFSEQTGHNIIGEIKGVENPEYYLVISAHYDHLGRKGNQIYNGTDDNASGVAAVLSFAQAIAKKPLKHSVLFLFTDGEEINLLGAKAFIKQQTTLLPFIKVNINIDMIAGNKNTKSLHYIDQNLDFVLPEQKLTLFRVLSDNAPIKVKRNFKRELHRVNSRVKWNNASDHGAFTQQKIPFIYYGVGEHKNYHTFDDNFENTNLPFFIDASESIYRHLVFIDEHIK